MTGTAETEAAEFHDIYKLDVLPIPTNRPCIRKDQNDLIFKSRREKFNAVVNKIQELHDKGQPILIGTASVDASETLSRMLKRAKIPHEVLNAKTTSEKRKSWRRPASAEPSPSPPTWRGAARTSSWAKA